MPYSKLNNDLEFNEDEWVVSLINTGKGLSGVFGGHAKIMVEGVRKKTPSNVAANLFSTELFVGEYHIMEAELVLQSSWIPQSCKNTKCKYLVCFLEKDVYSLEDQKYQEVSTRSAGGILPSEVMKMIAAIKKEHQDIQEEKAEANFQYAGSWCSYGEDNAENCISWAEKKLDIIGLGQFLITDSSKASPFLHVSSADALSKDNSWCSIL